MNTYFEWGNRNFLELNASKTKAMMVGTRAKLGGIIDPAPFNAGNSRILFVKSLAYLGTALDSELTLEPLYKNVRRCVDQKLFILRKIRIYKTEIAAKSMYKQMILPLLDCNGFLLVSCILDQRRELQKKRIVLYVHVCYIILETILLLKSYMIRWVCLLWSSV